MSAKKLLAGIDIGADSVKVVELVPKKKGFALKGIAEEKMPADVVVDSSIFDHDKVAEVIKAALKKAGIKNNTSAIALKGNDVMAKRVTVPLDNAEEIEETFIWEAEQYIQMDIEDVSIDYEIINVNPEMGQSEVLLAVARKELIIDYISAVEAAGLKAAVVDLESFAMQNLYEANYEVDEDTVILVNIGFSGTSLTFVRNGEYEFSRELVRGGKHLTETIAQKLGVSLEDADSMKSDKDTIDSNKELKEIVDMFTTQLAAEIRNSQEMFVSNSSQAPVRCFICGGLSALPGLLEKVEASLGIDVSLFDPFARISAPVSALGEYGGDSVYKFNVAAGLALRSAKE